MALDYVFRGPPTPPRGFAAVAGDVVAGQLYVGGTNYKLPYYAS